MMHTMRQYMQELLLDDPPRPTLHAALHDQLNVDAAAALLQRWTDKQRGQPIREWEHCDAATHELYRLLVYSVAFALVEPDEPVLMEELQLVEPPLYDGEYDELLGIGA